MCFACSLRKIQDHFFASFRFKFFASLQLNYVCFEVKQRENLFLASNISFLFKKLFFCIFSLRMFVSKFLPITVGLILVL
jgi:hypothetical protein